MNLQAASSLLITSDLQVTQAGIIGLGYVGLPPGHGRIRSTTDSADLNACAVLTVAYEGDYFNVTQFRNGDASVGYDLEDLFDRSVARLRIC